MGKNKKRDKKNFRRMKMQKKEQRIEGQDSGVVNFMNQRELDKVHGLNPKAKKLMK